MCRMDGVGCIGRALAASEYEVFLHTKLINTPMAEKLDRLAPSSGCVHHLFCIGIWQNYWLELLA